MNRRSRKRCRQVMPREGHTKFSRSYSCSVNGPKFRKFITFLTVTSTVNVEGVHLGVGQKAQKSGFYNMFGGKFIP